MVVKVRHTGIVVADMEKALSFYRDLLGIDKVLVDAEVKNDFLERISSLPGVTLRAVMLEAPDGNRVELLQYLSHPRTPPAQVACCDIGCSHLAFQVEDVEALYAKLLEAGVEANAPPQVDPQGYAKVTFVHDFDGTLIELVQILDETKTIYRD